MQSLTGTSLATAIAQGRPSCALVEVAWDGSTWVDESAYIRRISGAMEAADSRAGVAAIGSCCADKWTVTLGDPAGRFAEWNVASELYAHTAGSGWYGVPFRIGFGYRTALGAKEIKYVLKGHITNLEPTRALEEQGVTITASDKFVHWNENEVRTQLYQGYRTDQFAGVLVDTVMGTSAPRTLGTGLFSVPFVWACDENALRLLSQVAEAEGGRAYYSPSGDTTVTSGLVFENATHLLLNQTPVATFSASNRARMQGASSVGDRKNHVRVTAQPLRVAQVQPVWEAPEGSYYVGPGESVQVTAKFNAPAQTLFDPERDNDYFGLSMAGRDVTDAQTGGVYDLTVSMTSWAQQAELTLANAGTRGLYVVGLRLRGRPVVADDEQSVDVWIGDDGTEYTSRPATTPRGGWRTREMSNPLIQTEAHAWQIARMRAWREHAVPLGLRLAGLKGMSWLELADPVTVTGGYGLNALYAVQRIGHSWSGEDSYRMDVDVLPLAGLYPYTDYFLLGTDTLGTGTASPGRFFY